MKREFHVRFCERLRAEMPLPTRLCKPVTSQHSKPKLAKELQFGLRTRAKLLLLSFN